MFASATWVIERRLSGCMGVSWHVDSALSMAPRRGGMLLLCLIGGIDSGSNYGWLALVVCEVGDQGGG